MSAHPAASRIAIVGAGPAGLALALLAAQRLPLAQITLFDARTAEHDVSGDPRTLALALGSVQMLQRLRAWPAAGVQPITAVCVSQAPPTWAWRGLPAELTLNAADEGVTMLGAVLRYGTLVACMQQAWLGAAAAAPGRLHTRFGAPVKSIKALTSDAGVEIDSAIAEEFDLAVVAEGGVFAEQSRKALSHDYGQTAWVGSLSLDGATPGLAVERFTRDGPVALLPLPPGADGQAEAALVWCVPSADDAVAGLDNAQRIAVLNSLLPLAAGRVTALSPLKHFALGLNAERSLVDGCVVRIGNAAQTLHPVAGQGLNLGLRDAFALVQALRESASSAGGATLAQALRRVEWQRAPDRWSMIAITDLLARGFTWRWPGLPAARGLGLALLAAAPPIKSALARQMMFGRR